jgi:hypothetical protein
MSKFENPAGYTGRKATKDRSGQAKFATNAQAAAGLASDLMVSPLSMAGAVDDLVPDASLTVKGIVELATAAEMLAGVDTGRVPAVNVAYDYINSVAIAGAPAWSESVSGIGQLSTNAEAVAFTNDTTAMTPLKVAAVFAAPPATGSGTPAAGSFTTIAASGLSSLSGSATILTGGTALNLGSDNDAGAVNLGVGTTARAIGIGSSAAAHVVTIGSVTGASQVILNSGTSGIQLASTGSGDITINSDDTLLLDADGVLELNSSAGVIGIGSDADSNNINIGTAGARTITVGNGTGATSVVLESGSGAINIGTNAVGHSTTIGNKTGASALALDVGTGSFSLDGVAGSTYTVGASTTTGIMTFGGTSGTGTMTFGDSDGTQTVQIGSGEGISTVSIADGGTAANVVTIATGAVASTVAIGSASAGAISADSAAGISLDAATASNFSTSAALADLTLASAGGRVVISAGEDAADAIYLHADAGTSEVIRLHSDQGTGAASVHLESDVGGVTLTSGLASADAINVVATNGGVDVDAALEINIASSQAAATAISMDASDAAGGITVSVGTGDFNLDGDFSFTTSGNKILSANVGSAAAAGANSFGTCTLVAGTLTVSTTAITTNSIVYLTRQGVGATGAAALGELSVGTIVNGTSFVINSWSQADATALATTDVSSIGYMIVN